MSKTKKIILCLVSITGGVILIFVGGLYFWTNQSYEPTQTALQAMVTNQMVAINEDDLLVFTPIGEVKNTGFILYPGGLVEPTSYSPLARLIAQNGYTVVIVPMPFNLAVLDANAAQAVIDSFDHI
ncbi:MAG: alpha/beta hydrolase, partial [Turicibacter sp.]